MSSNLEFCLRQLAELLESIGEVYWLERVRVECAVVRPAEILGWFGGMGSLNDFYISKVNGHQVLKEDEDNLNQRLDGLRQLIYRLAAELVG
jgi:hypothetical protein